MEELLSLKWNNHRSTFLHILTILRDKQLYTDATLACEGRFYSVHRLVLSTCSDYFSAMFDRTTCKNPIIVLKDIKCEDLEALLDYMYLGEVNVRQADLASLIKAAECLRVKGLAVPDDEPPRKGGRGDNSNRRTDGVSSPPSKRKRRDEGQDGREGVRPSGRMSPTSSSRPKTPLTQSRLSPTPQDSLSDTGRTTSPSRLQSIDGTQGNNLPQSNIDGLQEPPFVKVEMEDSGGDDMGGGDAFNITNDGYKEEEEDEDHDPGDPGGDLSNDLPEFLQQATGSHVPGGSSFSHGSFPGTSSFQPGDLGWQGEGSNLNFPGHLNYSPTESSSQNAPGGVSAPLTSLPSLSALSSENLGSTSATMCLVCGKTFHSVWHMTRHLRTHTGERPFPCPFCPYRATQKNALQRHVQNLHGVVDPIAANKAIRAKWKSDEIGSTSKITSFAALLDSHLLDSNLLDSRLSSSAVPSSSSIASSISTTTITASSTAGDACPTTSARTTTLPSFSRALSNMISSNNHSWSSMLLSDSIFGQDMLLPNQ